VIARVFCSMLLLILIVPLSKSNSDTATFGFSNCSVRHEGPRRCPRVPCQGVSFFVGLLGNVFAFVGE